MCPHWFTPPKLWYRLKPLAREMRHEPTPAERALWIRIRSRQISGVRFRRQHAFDRFVLDFFCADLMLAIEVDGPVHDYSREEDAARQQFLELSGIRIIRFTNDDVLLHIDDVIAGIEAEIITRRSNVPPESSRGGRLPPR
jgi:very-short-patch-repair endonuclease